MFNIVSEEVKEDNTPEFRKCWALGEAFYYVKSYFENDTDKGYYYVKSKLEAIDNISKNLGLEDEKIYITVEDLRNKLPKDKAAQENVDAASKSLLWDLESYLKAGLTGKEPQFEYIFTTAKDCLLLYIKSEKTKDFLDNFNKFKNFISNDKFELIVNIVNYWKKHEFPDTNFPGEVKNRIAGLILGTIEISDILSKWDRVYWVLICYIIVGLIIILAAIFVITILFYIYQTFITKAPIVNETVNQTINATDVKSGDELTGTLTTVSTLAASIIPALGSAIIIWKRFANYVERKLAQINLTSGLKPKKS